MARPKKDMPAKIKDGRGAILRVLCRDIKAYEHIKIEDPNDTTLQEKRTRLLQLIKLQTAVIRSLRELELVEKDRQARGEDEKVTEDDMEHPATVTFITEANAFLKKNRLGNVS